MPVKDRHVIAFCLSIQCVTITKVGFNESFPKTDIFTSIQLWWIVMSQYHISLFLFYIYYCISSVHLICRHNVRFDKSPLILILSISAQSFQMAYTIICQPLTQVFFNSSSWKLWYIDRSRLLYVEYFLVKSFKIYGSVFVKN